jgi:hypothetical protein
LRVVAEGGEKNEGVTQVLIAVHSRDGEQRQALVGVGKPF